MGSENTLHDNSKRNNLHLSTTDNAQTLQNNKMQE